MNGRRSRVAFMSAISCAAVLAASGSAVGAPGARQVEVSVPIVTVSREQIEQTGLAIDVLKEINKVRVDPKGYAQGIRSNPVRIRGLPPRDVTEALTFLDGQRPLPPLIPSAALTDIAIIHIRDIGPLGLSSHTGSDGRTLGGRGRDRGIFTTTLAEELSFGQTNPRAVVFQLIVDPGSPGRPHRNDLFNPMFTQAGAACGNHKQFGSACVINLASPYLRDPPVSSLPPMEPPQFDCPAGQEPFEVDAWRQGAFVSLLQEPGQDWRSLMLRELARANATVYDRSTSSASLQREIEGLQNAGTVPAYGFCAPRYTYDHIDDLAPPKPKPRCRRPPARPAVTADSPPPVQECVD